MQEINDLRELRPSADHRRHGTRTEWFLFRTGMGPFGSGTMRLTEGTAVDLSTVAAAVNNIVTSAAVVVGGIWVYFNYIRGRTFARRAELDVTASLEGATSLYLCAAVTLKNSGQSRIPLNERMKAIRLFAIRDPSDEAIEVANWQRIMTLPILEQHAWLEALETVTDTVVYNLPQAQKGGTRCPVYQVEVLVGARRGRLSRRGTVWQSRAVLFQSPNSISSEESHSHSLVRTERSKAERGGSIDGQKTAEKVRQTRGSENSHRAN
jgi:hypothetical protein